MGMADKGLELYELLLELTGFDGDDVKHELDRLLLKLDMTPETLTLDDVRKAMIVYLDECSAEIAGPSFSPDAPECLA